MPELDYKRKYDDMPSMINWRRGLLISCDVVLFSNGYLRDDWILMTSILNEGQTERQQERVRARETERGGEVSRVTN